MRHIQNPFGLPQELSRSLHEIRLDRLPMLALDLDRLRLGPHDLAVLHHRPRKLARGDEPHGRNQEVRAVSPHGVADLAGQVRLEGLVDLDLLRGVVAAAADVEHVDAQRGEELGEADAAVDGPGFFF